MLMATQAMQGDAWINDCHGVITRLLSHQHSAVVRMVKRMQRRSGSATHIRVDDLLAALAVMRKGTR